MPHSVLDGDVPDLTVSLQDGTDEKIAITVVHRDRPELLNLCLQSIAVTSVNNNIEIIVVDNASTSKDAIDYIDFLEKEPDVKVIRNETNRWLAAAYNQGARAADRKTKYYVFMHQDCVVLHPAWLDMMIGIADQQGSGLLGFEEGTIQFDRQKLKYLQDWCLMMSRDCWRDCGPFAEELKQVGFTFLTTTAAGRFGYKPTTLNNMSLVHHYRAFSMDSSEYERMGEQSSILIPKLFREIQQKPSR